MVIVSGALAAATAVGMGVASGTAGYLAMEASSQPRAARDLHSGESSLASHLPDLTAWNPLGNAATAQVFIPQKTKSVLKFLNSFCAINVPARLLACSLPLCAFTQATVKAEATIDTAHKFATDEQGAAKMAPRGYSAPSPMMVRVRLKCAYLLDLQQRREVAFSRRVRTLKLIRGLYSLPDAKGIKVSTFVFTPQRRYENTMACNSARRRGREGLHGQVWR